MRDAYDDETVGEFRAERVDPDPEAPVPGREDPEEQGSAEGGRGDETPGDPPEDPEAVAARFPLNDYGNGLRLVHYYGANMLFVPRLGWYRWDETRWSADEDELTVRRDAQRVAGRIVSEANSIEASFEDRPTLDEAEATAEQLAELRAKRDHLDKGAKLDPKDAGRLRYLTDVETAAADIRDKLEKRRGGHRSHGKNSGNTAKISNMLSEARVEKACGVDDLNKDPLALNCQNGVVRFVLADPNEHDLEWDPECKPYWRAEFEEGHKREDLISKLVPVNFDRNAKCKEWHKFLETVLPSEGLRDFIQRWFGYSLTGLTTEQKMAFFFGSGRNGKSTAVDVIAKILDDYGTSIPIESLTGGEQRKGSDATPDLVRLPGARFVRASEPEQGQRMKEALIKQLTGGEPIMIRRMQQEFVEITPEFKLTISGNHKPEIRGGDDGIWRRVLLVPWAVQIAKEDVDPALPATLWGEAEGILAWMVEGCVKWLTDGLKVPDEVHEATAEYRSDSDPLRTFLQTECEITGSPDDFTKSRDIVRAFNAWMIDRGDRAWGARTISMQLKERSGAMKTDDDRTFSPAKKSDTGYRGIKISDSAWIRVELVEGNAPQSENPADGQPDR